LIDVPVILIVLWIHHRTFQQQTSDSNPQATQAPEQPADDMTLDYEKPGNRMTQPLLVLADARMGSINQIAQYAERLTTGAGGQNDDLVESKTLSSHSTVKTKSESGTVVSQD
jgi:hypothetical protein